jgi:pimeloyl-ACP methyl ester carboxylesterase
VRTAKGLAMALRYLALWSWRPASDARTTALYAPVAVTQEPRRKLRDVVAQAHPELPVENDNAPHLMKALGRVDFRPLVRNITCPILVLYGSRDAAMVAGGQMLRAGLRHAQVVVLPDVGHEPFIEARAQTVQTVRDFLLGQS